MSLQEIGDIMGVTRMRICQIEKRVAKKIRSLIGD
jgi:DNA-directed RNA polymerase specialized sigma subunit